MADDYIYKVIFFNQGEIYEIYARKVSQGGLFGFVEVEELAFGQGTKVVIDPSQERLEREFDRTSARAANLGPPRTGALDPQRPRRDAPALELAGSSPDHPSRQRLGRVPRSSS